MQGPSKSSFCRGIIQSNLRCRFLEIQHLACAKTYTVVKVDGPTPSPGGYPTTMDPGRGPVSLRGGGGTVVTRMRTAQTKHQDMCLNVRNM